MPGRALSQRVLIAETGPVAERHSCGQISATTSIAKASLHRYRTFPAAARPAGVS